MAPVPLNTVRPVSNFQEFQMFGMGEADENDFKGTVEPSSLPSLPASILTMGGTKIYPPLTPTGPYIVKSGRIYVGSSKTRAEAHEIALAFETAKGAILG